MPNDLNLSIDISLSISVWQSATYCLPITMHTTVPYNMATTDTTIDRVEFSDVTAPFDRRHIGNLNLHLFREIRSM